MNMKDMSNTLKKSFVFKRFYPELVEKYGTARAKDIWNFAGNPWRYVEKDGLHSSKNE